MEMKIEGDRNVQVGKLTIIEKMFGSNADTADENVDLSLWNERQLEQAKRQLFKERFTILYNGCSQSYMKKLFFSFVVFLAMLNFGVPWIDSFIASTNNMLSVFWMLLVVSFLFCLFILFIRYLIHKMKFDNEAINFLFKQNWQRKQQIDNELKLRKCLYWKEKCGVKKNLYEYFDKEETK